MVRHPGETKYKVCLFLRIVLHRLLRKFLWYLMVNAAGRKEYNVYCSQIVIKKRKASKAWHVLEDDVYSRSRFSFNFFVLGVSTSY